MSNIRTSPIFGHPGSFLVPNVQFPDIFTQLMPTFGDILSENGTPGHPVFQTSGFWTSTFIFYPPSFRNYFGAWSTFQTFLVILTSLLKFYLC